MRAPSFRSELARYQKETLELWPADPNDWERVVTFDVLAEWLDNSEAESVWSTISEKFPGLKPDRFIFEVLERCRLAAKLAIIVKKSPELLRKNETQIKRACLERRFDDAWIRDKFAQDFTTSRARALPREGRTAAKTWFMWHWSESFKAMCGQPLDDVVRVLTNIAFKGDEAVQIDTVRGAVRTMQRVRSRNQGTGRPK